MQQVPSSLLIPTLLFPHLALLLAAAAASGMAQELLASAPRSDCPSTCGDVEIPYPFGIGDGCSLPGLDHFNLTCDYSLIPPKPLRGNIEIVNISLEDGVMRVFTHVAYICYNGSNSVESRGEVNWKLSPTYLISPTRNEFTAIGCDTEAFLAGNKDWSYFTGCITTCVSVNEAANEGDDCAGLGCCKTHISPNLSSISVYWNGGNNTSNNSAWNYSPCSYAFVAEKGWYNFSRKDLIVKGNNSFLSRVGHRSVKLILDWAIKSHGTCDLTSLSAPACVSAHSFCDVKATKGAGYLCKCSVGYSGNPYITGPGGCTNINECELRQSNPTKYGELYPCHRDARCKDTDGDYECRCKFWFRGEGKTKEGCNPIFPPYAIAILAIISVVLVTCLGFFLLQTRKQRKFFNQNGGDLLKNLAGVKIFTKRELKKITKSYSDCIGTGFFGDVYKGIVDAGTQVQEVAVKCTVARKVARLRQKVLRPDDQVSQQEQDNSWKDKFVREITFQFQIKHPNVVRLIGCCLETDVPILVFEFVRHGSLHDRLHPADKKPCTLPLLKRLDIAVGAAEAISHMHSRGDYNHVHGDIKPANILLDDNLNAKVSDFGSSMLLSVKMYAVGVAADGIYADPVYYKTGRFTVKSDVYSFGVVLLELITGRTARYDEKSLAIDFEKSCKDEEKRRSMYDPYILSDDDPLIIKLLDMIGALAVECLSGDEDKRPTMAEVVVELKNVRSMAGGGLCSEGK